jgi:hypothetical protein
LQPTLTEEEKAVLSERYRWFRDDSWTKICRSCATIAIEREEDEEVGEISIPRESINTNNWPNIASLMNGEDANYDVNFDIISPWLADNVNRPPLPIDTPPVSIQPPLPPPESSFVPFHDLSDIMDRTHDRVENDRVAIDALIERIQRRQQSRLLPIDHEYLVYRERMRRNGTDGEPPCPCQLCRDFRVVTERRMRGRIRRERNAFLQRRRRRRNQNNDNNDGDEWMF